MKNGKKVVGFEIPLCCHNVFPFASLDLKHCGYKISRAP